MKIKQDYIVQAEGYRQGSEGGNWQTQSIKNKKYYELQRLNRGNRV